MPLSLRSLLLTVLLCSLASSATAAPPAPYCRVFRGYRLSTLSPEQFADRLAKEFFPAAPATHAKNGLVGYVPALPAAVPGIPDEIALVAYESEKVYERAKRTPEGKRYADLHWEVFDKAKSKTGGARPFEGVLAENDPVVMLSQPGLDWQTGHVMVFAGTRNPTIPRDKFLGEVTRHVVWARDKFGQLGLDGYVLSATRDFEVAWMRFKSAEAFNAALATADGKALLADANRIFTIALLAPATPFAGKIAAGQAVGVRFERRKRR